MTPDLILPVLKLAAALMAILALFCVAVVCGWFNRN